MQKKVGVTVQISETANWTTGLLHIFASISFIFDAVSINRGFHERKIIFPLHLFPLQMTQNSAL